MQLCVTFNYLNIYQFFYQRVYKLENLNHDYKNKLAAFNKNLEWGDKIPTGIFYKEERRIFEENFPQIENKSLVEYPIGKIKITKFLEKFS